MKLRISAGVAIAAFAVAASQSLAATPNLTTLVSFCAETNCTDGAVPVAGLIADANGDLFSTTQLGGSGGNGGTVYKIAKTASGYASTPTILYSFCSATVNSVCTDGFNSQAPLIADANGNLFGTTTEGGAHGNSPAGTVFEIAKTARGHASTHTTLYSFCTQTNCTDGYQPYAGLIADANGDLFGTTAFGGNSTNCPGTIGCGTVFEIAKTARGYANTPTTLVSFGGTDGYEPLAGLIADANGNLFGTTYQGGAYGHGAVFEIAKTASGYASTPTTLVSFGGTDGASPVAGLIADANGNLFGTTSEGGTHGWGTVFEIAKTASGYASTPTISYSFCAETNCTDGQRPVAGLIADANGSRFGTTSEGGAHGDGTVFEIAKTASGYASTPPPWSASTVSMALARSPA
jgi:uncharacterized repeat protein (TIGR03803 family)